METISLLLAGSAFTIWLVILCLPWQAWRTNEVFSVEGDYKARNLEDVTVLIPARNEEAVIAQTIDSVISQGDGIHVILIDDQSDDRTAGLAESHAGKHLTIIDGAPLPDGWTGKLWALQQAYMQVNTSFTLLLDADIELGADVIGKLREKMNHENLHFVSLMAAPPMQSFWEKLLMPAFVFFFKLLYPFSLVNSKTSRVAAAAGGCVLVQTEVLKDIGGFASIKSELIDDCALARRVKSMGYTIWLGLTRSVRSARPYPNLGEIWNMVARTAFTQLHYSPALLLLCTALMTVAFIVPLIMLAHSSGFVQLLGGAAFLGMIVSNLPTLRFYRRSPLWSLLMPLTASLYLAMIWTSALRFWGGNRSIWKGRIYQRVDSQNADRSIQEFS